MNILLVYPEFPDTYWSFRYALSFQGKRAAQPPLGLITVAALLPQSWGKRLVDVNVEKLKEADLLWADVVFLSAMQVQLPSLREILERCRHLKKKTIVGGPVTSSCSRKEIGSDHVVIGEAEEILSAVTSALEQGSILPEYEAKERPSLETSPLPDYSLIKMHRYNTMTVQYSRGCPFNCEFCDIIEIYGRRPRTKAVAQVLAELNQLVSFGWQGSVFVVDDNFIGNKKRAKELLYALVEWGREHKFPFRFITEASLNLADDPELLRLMREARFSSVFLGIETPEEISLAANGKVQNTGRDLLESVRIIQAYGIEVMGGFILGFDTDKEDIFDRMVEFIQKSAIPIAMVGLLQAVPGTQLFRRLLQEGRVVHSGKGNNTSSSLNFLPRMDPRKLMEGYRSVLRRVYSGEAYYERVKLYLERTNPYSSSRALRWSDLRALALSILRQGILEKGRSSYWRFFWMAATRYRHSFGNAIALAVMGYHFRIVTERLLQEG